MVAGRARFISRNENDLWKNDQWMIFYIFGVKKVDVAGLGRGPSAT